MEHKKTKLENKVSELKSKIEAIEKRNRERKDVEAKKREHEVEFLKYGVVTVEGTELTGAQAGQDFNFGIKCDLDYTDTSLDGTLNTTGDFVYSGQNVSTS